MANNFILFAEPWWVNLLFFIPFVAYYLWRNKLDISSKNLLVVGIFAVAFGLLEAAVVVYLRGAAGLLENANVLAAAYQQSEILSRLPRQLLNIEIIREAATMVMLICVALLAEKTKRERWAIYFWTFAIWDISYYLGLYIFIGWPSSLTTMDVLFLIPVPWYSQVWFALLLSGFFMLSVIVSRKKAGSSV